MARARKPAPSEPPATESAAPAGLSREAAENAISTTSPVDPAKDEAILAAESRTSEVEIEGRKDFFALRTRWSTMIIWWISILIAFNCALAILVGAGLLRFTEMPTFITAVTVETFLQIVALGAIAVRFLFSSGDVPPRS
jgi:hypothetical protein